jgi:membrane protease subunit (stomatin/prohibitin family)
MAPLFQVECPTCNAKNKQGSRFCGKCGERLPGSELKCGSCGATVAADKAFCANCGKPLSESASPLLTGNHWARRVEDFATRVEVDDVEGFFKKGLIVEAGTKAIFFVNGACSGILPPGRYEMGGLLQKIKNLLDSKTSTAVLVDTGDVELHFSVADLLTRDPIKLAAECRLVVQMDNPSLFFENMMKGRQNYLLDELRGFLEGELRNCLSEFLGGKSVQELSSSLAVKQQMEQGVAQHLATTFDRKGLSFIQIRIFDFRHPRLDSLTNKREEYWLNAQDLETKIAAEGATMGLDRRLLDQETAKALMQLEVYEDRAKVFARMRQAVASNEMNQVTSEMELAKFLQAIDKDKLLREEEMRQLVQDFGEKKEDHDLARAHLIQRLKIEQDNDLARAELTGKVTFNRTVSEAVRAEEIAQLDHELAARRKEVETRQAEEWTRIQQDVAAKRLEAGAAIDLGAMKKEKEIELQRKERTTEIETDAMETETAIRMLKQMKATKREEADWDMERELREHALKSETAMKESAQLHAQELAKIQVLSSLSTEALIAAAPADRAAMLAELKRTEGLMGLSEEQILAMAADKNPEIARAFQEKFRGSSAADVQKAYDRMLAMKDQSTADLKEMSREYAHMMQEMFNRGMDTQRDTATAAARSAQPGTMVITPGSGVVHTSSLGTDAANRIVCPKCHLKTVEGNKFCDNCGHKFYE